MARRNPQMNPCVTLDQVLGELQSLANSRTRRQMAHFGIRTEMALGVSVPQLRVLACRIGKNHRLALRLWRTRNHEARILAGMIADSARITDAQMERWARDFNSWDIVDGSCCNLFARAPTAWQKAAQWSQRPEEFVKRAGFALMAYLAYKDKSAGNKKYLRLLQLIRREATDDRHWVKKAVNWALRNIGKRNQRLNRAAVRTARELRALDSAAARWIASDALRELTGRGVQRRLKRAASRRPIRRSRIS